MFEVFKVFGLVVEVVIPPRRNKKGKRYGFVRFRKVRDERVMAVELDNIHIQGKKLFANIPRFQRGTQVVPPKEKKQENMEAVDWRARLYQSGKRDRNLRGPNKTYAQALGVNKEVLASKGKDDGIKLYNRSKNRRSETMDAKPSFAHLQFNIEKKDIVRFDNAFVGVVEKSSSTYNVQEALHSEGFFRINYHLLSK
ncbi:unnamed protein product [Lathyrus oleraceus]